MRHGAQSNHAADHAGTFHRPDDPMDLMKRLLSAIKSSPTIYRFYLSKPDAETPLMTASAVLETL